MRIDANALRDHYASLSDEELRAIDRDELTDIARGVYDSERSRRGLKQRHEAADDSADAAPDLDDDSDSSEAFDDEAAFEEEASEFDVETGPPPDWLDDAACACAFAMRHGVPHTTDGARARAVLRAAGIPCCITMRPVEGAGADADQPEYDYCVMVPGALSLHATSILDRDLFNQKLEGDWRSHFETMSDPEFRALKPEIFCAGMVDRVARLKRLYAAEVARRGLKTG